MKLRLLLATALALALMVPTALASDSTDGQTAGDDAPSQSDGTDGNDGVEQDEQADRTKKSDRAKKAKKHRKNKKHSMRDLCRPRVGVVVRGDLVSVDAAAGTFVVLVDKANRHGKRFVGDEVVLKLAKKGKVRKHGKATLADVQAAVEAMSGYRAKVMGRACRSEIRDENEMPELYAKHVKVKAPVTDDEESTEKESAESGETGDASDGAAA